MLHFLLHLRNTSQSWSPLMPGDFASLLGENHFALLHTTFWIKSKSGTESQHYKSSKVEYLWVEKAKAWENSSGFNGPWISPVFVSAMVLSSLELGKPLNFRSNKDFWIFNSKALLSPLCVRPRVFYLLEAAHKNEGGNHTGNENKDKNNIYCLCYSPGQCFLFLSDPLKLPSQGFRGSASPHLAFWGIVSHPPSPASELTDAR